jgi:hypothetical protein
MQVELSSRRKDRPGSADIIDEHRNITNRCSSRLIGRLDRKVQVGIHIELV